MNEHTKSLALKYAHKMGNSVLYNAEYLEEFAQLIVRECADVCQAVTNSGEFTGNQQYASAMCRDMVKKHFGVE